MAEVAAEAGSRSVAVRDPFRQVHRKKGAAGAAVENIGSVKPRLAKTRYVRFLTIRDLDGRSRAAMRTRELVSAFEADMGGADRLSTAQRQLVQRAAILAVQCEDFEVRYSIGQPIELDMYLAAINCQRRVLTELGLERRARDVTPSLQQYINGAGEGANGQSAKDP
jgi:hypothetical protein